MYNIMTLRHILHFTVDFALAILEISVYAFHIYILDFLQGTYIE